MIQEILKASMPNPIKCNTLRFLKEILANDETWQAVDETNLSKTLSDMILPLFSVSPEDLEMAYNDPTGFISENQKICEDFNDLKIWHYLSKYDYCLILEFLLNCKTVKKLLFFKISKNALDANLQYTVYKPVVQPNNDVIDYIAIKNNDIDQDLYDNERKEDYYLYLQKMTRNYTEYKYDVETSTILNVAARKGNIDIIKLLLNIKKIDVNIKSTKMYKKKYQTFDNYYLPIKEERTVLHEAVESGYSEVVQLLLKHKTFDVNSALIKTTMYEDVFSTANTRFLKKNEKILLHLAIEKGYIEIIKLLLTNSALDVNIPCIQCKLAYKIYIIFYGFAALLVDGWSGFCFYRP